MGLKVMGLLSSESGCLFPGCLGPSVPQGGTLHPLPTKEWQVMLRGLLTTSQLLCRTSPPCVLTVLHAGTTNEQQLSAELES